MVYRKYSPFFIGIKRDLKKSKYGFIQYMIHINFIRPGLTVGFYNGHFAYKRRIAWRRVISCTGIFFSNENIKSKLERKLKLNRTITKVKIKTPNLNLLRRIYNSFASQHTYRGCLT